MTEPYRLAAALHDGRAQTFIERAGALYPLDALLRDEERAALGGSPGDLMPFMADWPGWSRLLPERLASLVPDTPGLAEGELIFLPPIALPRKLVCIGANYRDHIAEMKIPMEPSYPYAFLKPASNTLRGSGAPVVAPPSIAKMDWEAELAVIIGRTARNVAAADALSFVAGYANFNDLSARDAIDRRMPVGIDWVMHKAMDGFAPMGPYMLPASFVRDPQDLPIRLSVNGRIKQNSNTAQMVFGVAEIIAHLSAIMTLEPGDVIATGTPAGVAQGHQPVAFLQPGDVVEVEIGDLGALVTPIISPG